MALWVLSHIPPRVILYWSWKHETYIFQTLRVFWRTPSSSLSIGTKSQKHTARLSSTCNYLQLSSSCRLVQQHFYVTTYAWLARRHRRKHFWCVQPPDATTVFHHLTQPWPATPDTTGHICFWSVQRSYRHIARVVDMILQVFHTLVDCVEFSGP